MDSTPINESLTEQREELMFSSLTNHNNKTSHFLKPTSITEAKLPPASSLTIKPSTLSVSFRGWRLPNKNFKLWASKMETLHKPTWIKAGIYEAITSSTCRVYKNHSLILSLAQKWCPETKTFVFPWGEVTLTLEDVNVLMGFSISGSSVFESVEVEETVDKLEKERDECGEKQCLWISRFKDSELEHEAFLVLWLSNFVFPDKYLCSVSSNVSRNVFAMAVRLAKGERIALAPAVLASLYNDFDVISSLASTHVVYIKSLFKVVQVWIWERFKSVRPEARVLRIGEPRIAQWSGVIQKDEGLFVLDGFEWRPYTKASTNLVPPRFYGEEGKKITLDEDDDDSFARCVRVSKLVGIGVVEDYYPNRVAMQFGFSQDVPVLVTTTHRNRKFTEKEAWDDYNQSLSGFKLYVPSRLATGSVTARYRDWWIKPVPKIQKEAFNAVDTVDHYDDGVALKIVPLSQVLEKLGDGTTEEVEDFANKGYKRARVCRQAQTEEGDGNITIARKMKTRKKYSDDVAKPEGESSRLEAEKSPMECFQTPRKKYTDDLAKPEGESSRLKADESPMECFQTSKKKCSDDVEKPEGESSRLEADYNNVPVLHVASNRVAGKEEEEDTEERLKQRKARIEEIGLKLEARMSKVGKTLAKIKQWKLKRINTKTQVLA